MITFYIKRLILISGFFISGALMGQANFTGYFEPTMSINYKASDKFSHNFGLANRDFLYFKNDLTLQAVQLDVSYFAKLKLNSKNSVALGILYRFQNVFNDNLPDELRFTEQYNITSQVGTARLGNRFRFEQRITSPLTTVFRFRYRIAIDVPLNGAKVDVGETYFVASTESLLSVAKGRKPVYGQRFTTQFGWLLSHTTKLQVGTEFRAGNYTRNIENDLYLLTGLVINL